MKKCPKCQKDLPDTALHCVFCGAKQDLLEDPAAANKTVMGYSASELLKNLGPNAPGTPGGPPPAAAPQITVPAAKKRITVPPASSAPGPIAAPKPASPMGAPTGPAPTPMAGPPPGSPMGGPSPGGPMGPPPGRPMGGPMGPPPAAGPPGGPMGPPPAMGPPGGPMGPPPAAGPPGGPMGPPPAMGPPGGPMGPPPAVGPPGGPMGPPPVAAPVASNQATVMANAGGVPGLDAVMAANRQGGSSPMGPPSGPAPTPMGGPPAMGPPGGPMGPPPMTAPSPMGPPPMAAPSPSAAPPNMVPVSGPGARPATAQVSPLKPPPYLASETSKRTQAPVEPWSDSLKLVMLIFGVLLVAGFAAPWSMGGDKMQFAWSNLKQANTYGKIMPMMFAGTGALAIVLGLLPLAALGRGIAAAGLGLAPILYQKFGAGAKLDWQVIAVLAGTITLVGGLLLRSQYKRSLLSRILVTIGVIAVILPYVIPTGGGKPILVVLFKALGDAPGKQKVSIILMLVPFVLACVSLLAWLPSTTSAGTHVVAWCWIALPLVVSVAGLLVAGQVGDRLKAGMGAVVWQPVAQMAWFALTGYGIATILGKQLEHS